jgi:hypothetical protein
MKVALLISGYIRTFELNLSSLEEKILSKFNNVDIFLHITREENEQDKYLNIIKTEDIDKIKSILKPKIVIEEDNLFLSSDSRVNNTINTWLKYYKLNQLKKNYEDVFGEYDLVIKYRPDLNIESDISFDIEPDTIYIPNDSKIDKLKLINNDDSYICDIFAYGDSKSMNTYFDLYKNISYLIEKYGPISETVLFNYLNDFNINYKIEDIKYNIILSLCNIFAICGDSGSGKTTIGNLLKKYFSSSFMLECDRYHKWERGNDNWKSITHLNPDANYIAKMNDDIFDLKIGKSIYQVDYDHHSGKFTEKEKIETSDNIIVCGLHSLYSKNDLVYNLKIFMDTDINLKYSWKIKRDTTERGYSLEKILNQIKSRETDYIDYIYPQREKSDVIINFTTDDKFEINNINKDLNVYLNIYFNKKINLSNIINSLIKHNINLSLNEEDKFNKLTFTEYKNCELFNKTKFHNFYDYIMYILLNIQSKK